MRKRKSVSSAIFSFLTVIVLLASGNARADYYVVDSFNPIVDHSVDYMAVQTDGKILICGDFSVVNGTAMNCSIWARLAEVLMTTLLRP